MTPEQIESVGVDFDDVLLDAFPTMAAKITETASIMGLEVPAEETIAKEYGYIENTVRKLFPDTDHKRFLDVYSQSTIRYSLVTGAREAIAALISHGVPLWMFTGRPLAQLRKRAEEVDLNLGQFYPIITKDDTEPYRKPDEMAFDTCVSALTARGVRISRALYVDDSLPNYRIGKKKGFISRLLLGSPNSREYEGCVPSEDVMTSMWQLPEIVRRLPPIPA